MPRYRPYSYSEGAVALLLHHQMKDTRITYHGYVVTVEGLRSEAWLTDMTKIEYSAFAFPDWGYFFTDGSMSSFKELLANEARWKSDNTPLAIPTK